MHIRNFNSLDLSSSNIVEAGTETNYRPLTVRIRSDDTSEVMH